MDRPTAPTLSVAIIAKNEEKNLARLLPSVQFADQIVVVETDSTDQTATVAKEHGATVISQHWQGYTFHRNASLEACQSDWILILDADETVSEELANEIKRTISDGAYDGYELPFRNHLGSRQLRYGGWYPDYHLRLIRRGAAKFEGDIHEALTGLKRVGRLREPVNHYPYATISDWLEKVNRYTSLEAAAKPFSVDRLLLKPPATFLRSYILWSGYRDGLLGFVASSIGAWYKFIVEVKRWERR